MFTLTVGLLLAVADEGDYDAVEIPLDRHI